jgi:hypothetical protein
LHQEQANQNRDADRNDNGRELGCVELETFDGAEHRDRGRDHAVAVKQRRADQPDNQQRCAQASAGRVPDIEEGQKRYNSAFAVIVGAQDQDGVFERNNHDQ